MFEPYMKSFYVRSTDSTHIKTLKVNTLLMRRNIWLWWNKIQRLYRLHLNVLYTFTKLILCSSFDGFTKGDFLHN